ncbi:AraC family transcriptional regulator [Paenibacillus sp. CAA11]|uniref:Ada metal-binding domain-containing protein n=1 Tax=Paenibacillus sp. CAA11 TaxID=1532905 RepID=UPI000D3BB293|nr:Ada metal-binding domain-containing protein [Paenibacillus sp. CAA11]AWB44599.1 AraC family transcriptional regulator [Paenibacillus sp. CAA11]
MDQKQFDQIYSTVMKKDSTYDGIYYTCVKTTKIFCRPSCRARTPYPQNVIFMTSVEDAVKAGFRPCKRCRPEVPGRGGPDEQLANKVDELLQERLDRSVTLRVLASELSVSPYHLMRVYKRVRGYSPADHLRELRLEQTKCLLRSGANSIAEIGRSVGYTSAAHFSAWFKQACAVTPAEYRDMKWRGADES